MKILLLAHRLPYPLESGQHVRLYHMARALSRRHSIRLIAFGEPPYAEPLTEVFEDITTLPVRTPPRPRLSLGRLRRVFDAAEMLPYETTMEQLIRDRAAEWGPDAIWIGGWDMLVYAGALPRRLAVADVMDDGVLETLRDLRTARGLGPRLRALKGVIDNICWERHYFPTARRCVFVSAVDALWARRVVPGLAAVVVENGVDTEYFAPGGAAEDHPSLIFEGNQAFPPNVDAVRFFAREIFPRVLDRVPECRFYVVGRDPVPETRSLVSDRIIVTGRVEDVRPYLDRASVFVCPLRRGAGIKNKLLQAWAMAKPVVATRAAAGGLRVSPGENIVLADDPRTFGEETAALLRDPIRRRQLGKLARETALAHYTWPQQARGLEAVFQPASER